MTCGYIQYSHHVYTKPEYSRLKICWVKEFKYSSHVQTQKPKESCKMYHWMQGRRAEGAKETGAPFRPVINMRLG